ncbi:S8 family serine peptidase [Streptomyces prasinus]
MWQTSTGEGVTVAVIDSGVDPSNPDLEGRVLPCNGFHSTSAPSSDRTGRRHPARSKAWSRLSTATQRHDDRHGWGLWCRDVTFRLDCKRYIHNCCVMAARSYPLDGA